MNKFVDAEYFIANSEKYDLLEVVQMGDSKFVQRIIASKFVPIKSNLEFYVPKIL